MSYIKSYNDLEFMALKDFCKNQNLNSDLNFLNEITSKNKKVTVNDLEYLLSLFLDAFDYYNYTLDDSKIKESQKSFEELFTYLDNLDMSRDASDDFCYKFMSFILDYSKNMSDSKAIYNLITSPEIINSRIMQEYMSKLTYNEDTKSIFFIKYLNELFSSLSDEDIEKVNYIFLTSAETLRYFIASPKFLNNYFKPEFISNFNKETLSLLFRNCLGYNFQTLCNSSEKVIKVVSAMNDYLIEHTNRNAYFFNLLFDVFDDFLDIHNENNACVKLQKLLVEYYDKYFIDSQKDNFENDEMFRTILFVILDQENSLDILKDKDVKDLDSLCEVVRKKMDYLYTCVFTEKGLLNLKYDVFDLNSDFVEINNFLDLHRFKNAFLKRVYGISSNQAEYIANKYGSYLDICKDEIANEDHDIFEIVKSITNISNLFEIDSKIITKMQYAFHDYVKEHGFYKLEKNNSYPFLLLAINRMFMKPYINSLFKIDDRVKNNLIDVKRGVPIIDAGLEFNMMVTALNGVNSFYSADENVKGRYNSSSKSFNQGFCASYINNENLGVISLTPLVGYSNLDVDSLNAMGFGDIYSGTEFFDLLRINHDTGHGNYFLTPKKLIDHTRFGYNEMLINRFLVNDKNNDVKVQPSYVVVYKMDDNYKKSKIYKKGLKMAKEFNIPLVLVDVPKIKEHEKEIILRKEDQLFSSRQVDKELLSEIITRYMNNYSGSLTIVGSSKTRHNEWEYDEDFSVSGLKEFVNKVEKRFSDLSLEEINSWIAALSEAYELEKSKNEKSLEITNYGFSLKDDEFLLDDEIDFPKRIGSIYEVCVNQQMKKSNLIDEKNYIKFSKNDFVPKELDVVFNLANLLYDGDRAIAITKDEDDNKMIYLTNEFVNLSEEDKQAYGLVLSYLIGDYRNNYYTDIFDCDLYDIRLDTSDSYKYLEFDIKDSSKYKNTIINEKIISLTDKLREIDDNKYLEIFKPYTKIKEQNLSYEGCYLMRKNIIDRKNCASKYFGDLIPTVARQKKK